MTFDINSFKAGIATAKKEIAEREETHKLDELAIKTSLKSRKISPFAYVNHINSKTLPEHYDGYDSFLIDVAFSIHPDSIMSAAMMNRIGQHLTKKQQFDYYNSTITKGMRKGWVKKFNVVSDINIISIIYNLNYENAHKVYEQLMIVDEPLLREMITSYQDRIGGR